MLRLGAGGMGRLPPSTDRVLRGRVRPEDGLGSGRGYTLLLWARPLRDTLLGSRALLRCWLLLIGLPLLSRRPCGGRSEGGLGTGAGGPRGAGKVSRALGRGLLHGFSAAGGHGIGVRGSGRGWPVGAGGPHGPTGLVTTAGVAVLCAQDLLR